MMKVHNAYKTFEAMQFALDNPEKVEGMVEHLRELEAAEIKNCTEGIFCDGLLFLSKDTEDEIINFDNLIFDDLRIEHSYGYCITEKDKTGLLATVPLSEEIEIQVNTGDCVYYNIGSNFLRVYLNEESMEEKAQEYTSNFVEQLIESFHEFDFAENLDDEPEEVETEASSGFIPWTDGGHIGSVCGFTSRCESTGSIPTEAQKYIDRDNEDIEKGFCEENNIKYPLDWDSLTREQEHNYYDYESDYYMEEPPFFMNARAFIYNADNSKNEAGEIEIYFTTYLCWDFEYNRPYIAWAGGDTTTNTFEKTVKVSDIMLGKVSMESIIKEAIEHQTTWYDK
jgi:hypothetical protein